MRTFTSEQLQQILADHALWLEDSSKGKRADLSYSNLRGSNLSDSNLSGSNLRGSNLRGSDLRGSNLRGSDLSYSNLSDSNLSGSDLSDVKLWSAIGNMVEIKSLLLSKWIVTYTHDKMQIGCQKHLIKDWFKFTDEQICEMDSEALKWWTTHKKIIEACIKASPAIESIYIPEE